MASKRQVRRRLQASSKANSTPRDRYKDLEDYSDEQFMEDWKAGRLVVVGCDACSDQKVV